MKMKFLSAFIFIGTLLVVKADEKFATLQAGSEVYSNVTVTSVSVADVFFTHAKGMGNIKIKNLSPELQQHFGFDTKKAQAVERQQAENKVKYHDQLLRQPTPPPTSFEGRKIVEPMPATGKKIWAKSFLNQKAPGLIVEKWLTPEPDGRGKFVLIDFWATWCPPCRAAIPELNAFREKFGDRLVVIGISDETEAAVKKLTNPQIKYAVAIDTKSRTKNIVEVTGIPHVLLIDPQGFVRWEGFPFSEGNELNEKVVAEILAKYSN